jgi:hypothetical protein
MEDLCFKVTAEEQIRLRDPSQVFLFSLRAVIQLGMSIDHEDGGIILLRNVCVISETRTIPADGNLKTDSSPSDFPSLSGTPCNSFCRLAHSEYAFSLLSISIQSLYMVCIGFPDNRVHLPFCFEFALFPLGCGARGSVVG